MGESRERKWRDRRLSVLRQVDESQRAAKPKKPREYGAFLLSAPTQASSNFGSHQSMVATTGV
jgi:hypothetical protein